MVMMMMVGGNDDDDDDDDGGGDDEPFNILHCESLRTPRPQAQAQGIEIEIVQEGGASPDILDHVCSRPGLRITLACYARHRHLTDSSQMPQHLQANHTNQHYSGVRPNVGSECSEDWDKP